MSDKKPGSLPEPRIPKILKEVAQAFRREQSFASDESKALWFSRWDSIPFETRNELMMKYQITALSGKAPAELESIRKGIEDQVVKVAEARFGAAYSPEDKRQLLGEVRNTSTEMLNRLLEQELKRTSGDKKANEQRTAARASAERYATAEGRVFTTGAKPSIESKASYRPDPDSFKSFSPEDLEQQKRKLAELKAKYEVTQLADKIRTLRQAGAQEELSAILAQQLALEESRLGVSADTRLGASEKLRHEITILDTSIKEGGVGGFKIAIPDRKPVVIGQKIQVVDIKDEEGRKIGRETVVEDVYGMASRMLPEGGGRGVESADARAFAQRVRNESTEDRVAMVLGLTGENIEDLRESREGKARLNKLRKDAAADLAPMIRAGNKGAGAVSKAIQFSEKTERTAIGEGKALAKEKMGAEAWAALSTEQKEQAGAEYADRFYKPFVFRTGPTGKSEDGLEFAKADPQASALLNQKPQFRKKSGWGMKMRSAAGADKRVIGDEPEDSWADVTLWRELRRKLGKRVADREAKYLNPRWIAAAFGNDVLEAVKQRKAAQTDSWDISTKITSWDLHAIGVDIKQPKFQIVAPIVPTMFGQALKEWHIAHMRGERDPTLATQIYARGKLLDVNSKEGKRELFIRGARATLYGAKVGGAEKIVREARKVAQEYMDETLLYVGDSDEAKAVYAAKLDELMPLVADLMLSREPAPTRSYNDKIRAFNERLFDKGVKSPEETRQIRGERIARSTSEEKIGNMAEEAVFDRYSKVVNQIIGAEPKRGDFRERVETVKGSPIKVDAETQWLAAKANWVERYNAAFNRLATNLDEDLAEEKTKIRGGARAVASGSVILRKKNPGEKLDGLGFGFGAQDLGSKAVIIGVGALVAFSIFKAAQATFTKA